MTFSQGPSRKWPRDPHFTEQQLQNRSNRWARRSFSRATGLHQARHSYFCNRNNRWTDSKGCNFSSDYQGEDTKGGSTEDTPNLISPNGEVIISGTPPLLSGRFTFPFEPTEDGTQCVLLRDIVMGATFGDQHRPTNADTQLVTDGI